MTGPWAGNTPTTNIFNPATNRMNGQNYTNSGNLRNFAGNPLTYDAENHVKTVATTAWTFAYDGLGQRVQKKGSDGSGTVYVYDAFGRPAAEYASTASGSSWSRDYIRAGADTGVVATENISGSAQLAISHMIILGACGW